MYTEPYQTYGRWTTLESVVIPDRCIRLQPEVVVSMTGDENNALVFTNPEMTEWCNESLSDWIIHEEPVSVLWGDTGRPPPKFFRQDAEVILIMFSSDADMVLFKLRWL